MNIKPIKKETSYFFHFRVEDEDYIVVANRHRSGNTYDDVDFLVRKHNIHTENLYGQSFKCMSKKNITFYAAEMVLRAYFDSEKIKNLYTEKYKECDKKEHQIDKLMKECDEKQHQIDELIEKFEGVKNED